jgi:hypothetical protein
MKIPFFQNLSSSRKPTSLGDGVVIFLVPGRINQNDIISVERDFR